MAPEVTPVFSRMSSLLGTATAGVENAAKATVAAAVDIQRLFRYCCITVPFRTMSVNLYSHAPQGSVTA